jgi:hypothetical protein
MLRDIDKLFESFQDNIKKSKEQCGDKLEEIRQLVFIQNLFFKSLIDSASLNKEFNVKILNSLALTCLMELVRISGHIIFFSFNGLYRNAFDNIRYAMESIVQAVYIDNRHPKTPLHIRIEILKEVEDKREYHATRLIDELEIHYKNELKREYKQLSRIVHPSHQQIIATLDDLKEKRKGIPATIDCNEVTKIYDSMARMHDIFFFLFINHFPEMKETLSKNHRFVKAIKSHNLILLSKVLKVRPK